MPAIPLQRDAQGVAHLSADSLADALRVLGQCHARDRGLQMLLVRILGQGRACELLADDAGMLVIDRFFRRMHFSRGAAEQVAQLSPEHRRLLDAYCAGVNEGLRRTPWEFRLVGYRAEPWAPTDTVLMIRLVAFIAMAQTQGDLETLLVQLVQAGVSQPHLEELFPGLLEGLDVELLGRVKLGQPLVPAEVRFHPAMPKLSASNNWAIAGRKTASGAPILASDPHLEVNRLPALWYEVALQYDGRYCLGATIPGLPAALIGRTRDLAWGATYSFLDAIDSWIEDCRDGACRRETAGGTVWVPFEVRKETIRRKGGPPVEMTFYENEHGTLDGDATSPGLYRATRWAGRDSGAASIAAMFDLLAASTVEQGGKLLGQLEPSFNWVLADRAGGIAYQMSGCMPRRPKSRGLVPLPGWDAAHDWQGFVMPAELPQTLNPACGYVVTANNDLNALRPAGAAEPINACMGSYRADRIAEQLAGRDDWTIETTAALQMDLSSRQAGLYLEVLRPILAAGDWGPQARVLADWDGRYTLESRGATAFERFYVELFRSVFGGVLGAEAARFLWDETCIPANYYGNLDRILLSEQSLWFAGRSRAELYREACARALAEPLLPWGQVQQLEFKHLLLGEKLPPWLGFNRGPFAVPGSRATIHQIQTYRFGGREACLGPGLRMATDLHEDAIHTALAGGPSDRRFSRWYASGLADWLAGRLKRTTPGRR